MDFGTPRYDEWVAAVFDHAAAETEPENRWYWHVECRISSPSQALEHLARAFGEFRLIGQRFSLPQLNQGVWLLLGPRLRVSQYLYDASVPWTLRAACIEAMYSVFSDFVAGNPEEELENCFYMWWELVTQGEPSDGMAVIDDRHRTRVAILEVLRRVLTIQDQRCQMYALHGLGHLPLEGARDLVRGWLAEHRSELTEDDVRWVERCQDGTVQ
jgi:hypothetical protein